MHAPRGQSPALGDYQRRSAFRRGDPDEEDSDIARLRVLHAAMDRAVLDAYGWRDARAAERASGRPFSNRSRAILAAEPRPLWGTSDD